VDYFFGVLLGTPLDEISLQRFAEFLSSDIVQKHDSQFDKRGSASTSTPTSVKSPTRPTIITKEIDPPTKQGYLTKRGKNFGGWQTRYFVLEGPQLKYFDTVPHYSEVI
jgi:RalA-binding protein 1